MEDVSVYSLAKAARENPEKSANLGEPQRRDKGQHCVFIDNASRVFFVVVDAEDDIRRVGGVRDHDHAPFFRAYSSV